MYLNKINSNEVFRLLEEVLILAKIDYRIQSGANYQTQGYDECIYIFVKKKHNLKFKMFKNFSLSCQKMFDTDCIRINFYNKEIDTDDFKFILTYIRYFVGRI